MSAGGLKDARVVIAAFAATVLLSIGTALITPAETPAADGPSSVSSAPAGGKAAFLTLQALGYPVERSYEPMTQVRADPRATVLLITGRAAPSEQDKRAMLAFIAAGGVALVAGSVGAEFLGIEDVEHSVMPGAVVTHRVLTPSPVVSGVTEITMPGPGQPLTFERGYVTLFAQTEQQPLLTTSVIGNGRVIWMAAPTPLMNEHIGKADNLQLLLNIVGPAGERVVLWDEHYHGFTRSLWSYAVHTPLPWMALQLGIIACCALMAFGRRSSPIRPRHEVPRTSPLEFIDMLGALYRRSGAAPAAIRTARARFFAAAASVCAVPSERGSDAVASAVAARLGVDSRGVVETLRGSAAAAGGSATDVRAAIALTRELQDLTARLYALRRSRRPLSVVQES